MLLRTPDPLLANLGRSGQETIEWYKGKKGGRADFLSTNGQQEADNLVVGLGSSLSHTQVV